MRETHGPPKLPEGYRLDLSADPDAPALRRPDGTVVARFAVGGTTYEAVEREALEDLLRTSRKPGGGGSPSPRVPRGAPWATTYPTPLRGKTLTANIVHKSSELTERLRSASVLCLPRMVKDAWNRPEIGDHPWSGRLVSECG